MSNLKEQIKQLIALSGPISVSQYMTMALADPQNGYYQTANPFGAKGDFITAPEVSQMFGEMIGVWAFSTWQKMNTPPKFVLCEIGPGRATLMKDVLRTITQLSPDMLECANIFMVETSKRLIEEQKSNLSADQHRIQWVESFNDVQEAPLILFANELFDALPIHQYIKTENNWLERVITLDQNDELCFAIGFDALNAATLPASFNSLSEGTVIELSPMRNQLMVDIATTLSRMHGSALLIDYGASDFAFGDTLQAMTKHQYSDIFKNPGQHDLTTHVDFSSLKATAIKQGCIATIQEQGDFLIKMGLLERAGQLGHDKDIQTQTKLRQDVERLAAPDQMGTLFKVLCVSDKQTGLLPVFQ